MIHPIPLNEKGRLAALQSLDILDTTGEKEFDELVSLAAYIWETPIALISFIDADRQWIKSGIGFEQANILRDVSFCSHTILSNSIFVVGDTSCDNRFSNNPLVTGDPHIRFYAGMPLVTADGYSVGTLCVMDREPRQISTHQNQILKTLANLVMRQIEIKKISSERVHIEEQLREKTILFNETERLSQIGSWEYDSDRETVIWSEEMYNIVGMQRDPVRLVHEAFLQRIHPEDREQVHVTMNRAIEAGEGYEIEFRVRTDDGREKILIGRSICLKDDGGKVIKRRGIVQDVTERKKAFAALVDSREQEQLKALKHQVEVEHHRTQIETLREVTLTLMDRINNPLAIIAMTLESFRKGALPDGFLDRINSISKETKRISEALSDAMTMNEYRTKKTSFGKVLDMYAHEDKGVREKHS